MKMWDRPGPFDIARHERLGGRAGELLGVMGMRVHGGIGEYHAVLFRDDHNRVCSDAFPEGVICGTSSWGFARREYVGSTADCSFAGKFFSRPWCIGKSTPSRAVPPPAHQSELRNHLRSLQEKRRAPTTTNILDHLALVISRLAIIMLCFRCLRNALGVPAPASRLAPWRKLAHPQRRYFRP